MPPNVAIPNGFYYSTASYLGARYDPMEVGDPNKPDFSIPKLKLIDDITAVAGHKASWRRQSLTD